jgi:hypothetical protein
MMSQRKRRIKRKAANDRPVATRVIRITDRDYEGLLKFGEAGKPLSVAFRKCLEAAAEKRAASAEARHKRMEDRMTELLQDSSGNTTERQTAKEIQIQNQNGVKLITVIVIIMCQPLYRFFNHILACKDQNTSATALLVSI